MIHQPNKDRTTKPPQGNKTNTMTKTEKLNQIEADLDNIYDQIKKANSSGETIKLLTEKMVLEGQVTILNMKFDEVIDKDNFCNYGSLNYGYGFAKCYDCGKIKNI